MRKTLTIDDDIAKLIDREVRRSGDSFKSTVNKLLKIGLMAANNNGRAKKYVVTPFPLGIKPGGRYDSISELIEELEGPLHR